MTDFQKEVLTLTNISPDVTMGAIIHAAERFGMKDENALYPLTNEPPYSNIIAFYGINEDAMKELSELSKRNWIEFNGDPCNIFAYSFDGGPVPELPLAKGLRKYSKPHFLPLLFKITEKGRAVVASA